MMSVQLCCSCAFVIVIIVVLVFVVAVVVFMATNRCPLLCQYSYVRLSDHTAACQASCQGEQLVPLRHRAAMNDATLSAAFFLHQLLGRKQQAIYFVHLLFHKWIGCDNNKACSWHLLCDGLTRLYHLQ
jgi:hypothetical protein